MDFQAAYFLYCRWGWNISFESNLTDWENEDLEHAIICRVLENPSAELAYVDFPEDHQPQAQVVCCQTA
jgi:hypothetical protein